MSSKSTTDMVGAALVGGAIGAGLALLFAPRSGKETRERIQEGAANIKNEAGAKLLQAKGLKSRVTTAARNTVKTAKSEFHDTKAELQKPSRRRQSPVLSAWEEEV